jgi:hypothetical protein
MSEISEESFVFVVSLVVTSNSLTFTLDGMFTPVKVLARIATDICAV